MQNRSMDHSLAGIFLECSARRLAQYAARIEDCLGRLTDEQVWGRGGPNENAVGNLVLHLCGNLGQWILAGLGGAPDTRQRDAEFSAHGGPGRRELAEKLAGTVREAAAVIERFPAGRLTERIRIQNYELTAVVEGIYHVVDHFAEHTGQIILLTKAATGQDLGYYAHLKSGAAGSPTP